MSNVVKSGAVRFVKPLVSDRAWERLRSWGGAGDAREVAAPEPTRQERLRAMNLTELAQEFKTDKFGTHRYTPHYEHHLEAPPQGAVHPARDRHRWLLTSGSGGASLRMWKHFFPRAQIVGLDIQDKSFAEARRIRTYQGSQVERRSVARVVEETGPI